MSPDLRRTRSGAMSLWVCRCQKQLLGTRRAWPLVLPSALCAVGGNMSVTVKGSLSNPGTSPPGSGRPSA